MERHYQIVVIGAGPAGQSAGLYAARADRRSLLIERRGPGGQIATTGLVENYPGFPDGIGGYDLGQQMQRQAEKYGLETLSADVTAIERAGDRFRLTTSEGPVLAESVILTGGGEYVHLGVPAEERLTGRGVSYCATCDAPFFRDEDVVVVGGGDAALDEGLFVARYARSVTLVHRRDRFRASQILQNRVLAEPSIRVQWHTVVTAILGDDAVTGVRLLDLLSGAEWELPAAAVFIFIGQRPNTGWLGELLTLDPGGHVPVNLWMETAVPGLFAAGDIRTDSARQVASAVGDGATAAIRADQYLSARAPAPTTEPAVIAAHAP